MEGCKRSTQETEIEVIRRKVVLMRAGVCWVEADRVWRHKDEGLSEAHQTIR